MAELYCTVADFRGVVDTPDNAQLGVLQMKTKKTKIQIEIECAGKHCGDCKLRMSDGCQIWDGEIYPDENAMGAAGDEPARRLPACIAAEAE